MNELAKKRMKASFKYNWPFYLVSAVVITILFNFIFGITHKLPAHQTITIFVSGEMVNSKKLNGDLLEKYQENELKSVSCISASPSDGTYYSKLSIPGYNTADVLIIPVSRLDNLVVSSFGLDLSDELINSYYPGYALYAQEGINYGVKIDVEKVKEYMTLPNEDCYMILNGKSQNIGEYAMENAVKEHDTALQLVKDWGM